MPYKGDYEDLNTFVMTIMIQRGLFTTLILSLLCLLGGEGFIPNVLAIATPVA